MTTSAEIKKEQRQSACDMVKRKPRKDLTGLTFDHLTVSGYVGSKHHTTYWACKCVCGNEKIVRYSHLVNHQIKSCGCLKDVVGNQHWRWNGFMEMSGSFLLNTRNNARSRNIPYNVTNNELWELFLRQKRCCALSGLEISFVDQTASLDRIDSDKGYTTDNIQWVHKDINRMKNAFSEERFAQLCLLVVRKKGLL